MIDRYLLLAYSDMKREMFSKVKNTQVVVCSRHRSKKKSNIKKEKNIFLKDRMQEIKHIETKEKY